MTLNIIKQVEFELPSGFTAKELADATRSEITELVKQKVTYGKIIRLYGRMTTGMTAVLGHELAHISKSVEIFDPKEGYFYQVIAH